MGLITTIDLRLPYFLSQAAAQRMIEQEEAARSSTSARSTSPTRSSRSPSTDPRRRAQPADAGDGARVGAARHPRECDRARFHGHAARRADLGRPRHAAAGSSTACPLNRAGQPSELVGACLLLASDAGSFLTGQTLHRRRRRHAPADAGSRPIGRAVGSHTSEVGHGEDRGRRRRRDGLDLRRALRTRPATRRCSSTSPQPLVDKINADGVTIVRGEDESDDARSGHDRPGLGRPGRPRRLLRQVLPHRLRGRARAPARRPRHGRRLAPERLGQRRRPRRRLPAASRSSSASRTTAAPCSSSGRVAHPGVERRRSIGSFTEGDGTDGRARLAEATQRRGARGRRRRAGAPGDLEEADPQRRDAADGGAHRDERRRARRSTRPMHELVTRDRARGGRRRARARLRHRRGGARRLRSTRCSRRAGLDTRFDAPGLRGRPPHRDRRHQRRRRRAPPTRRTSTVPVNRALRRARQGLGVDPGPRLMSTRLTLPRRRRLRDRRPRRTGS